MASPNDRDPHQEYIIWMQNDDQASVTMYEVGFEEYQCEIDYRLNGEHEDAVREGPALPSEIAAFDAMMGTLSELASGRSTTIIEVENVHWARFVSAADQKAVLERRGISAIVTVDGEEQ
jgi:hypothetical protein